MSVEIVPETPLAEALNNAILPKLVEAGWGTGGEEDNALAEYIILLLVNGKTQEQVTHELSTELLGLSPDDPAVLAFSQWLFETIPALQSQVNGGQSGDAAGGEMDTDMGANDASEINAPTGPRALRNNGAPRGGPRDKRMMGQVHKHMERANDAGISRVRGQTGNERIGRTPPSGPRGRGGRHNNNMNNRAASIQAGMAGIPGQPGGQWMMSGSRPNQMELMAMLEQQNQMMFQLSQQLASNQGGRGRGGKSLFDRAQNPNHRGNRGRGGHHNHTPRDNGENNEAAGGEDMDMSGSKAEAPNPEETICRFNLRCTNKDCKFAHQSPAAPPGANIDVNDVCTFGAACKNRKCVARHPSPATKLAHQSELECKFWPQCQNPQCPFRHPSHPPCKNGANCTDEGCKFTHLKTKCKFNPCKNPRCPFVHDEGQQGGFKDKVWTPGSQNHVSERSFVDENAPVENVKAEDDSMVAESSAQATDVIG